MKKRGMVLGGVMGTLLILGSNQIIGTPNTDLLAAIMANDLTAAKRHLQEGANPNTCDTAGTPILNLALTKNNDLACLLLEHGANPDLVDARMTCARTIVQVYITHSLIGSDCSVVRMIEAIPANILVKPCR